MKGILLDGNNDFDFRVKRDSKGLITAGLIIGDCMLQVCERIIGAWQGEFKELPTLGCNAKKNINGNPDVFWAGEVRGQLKSQGIKVKRLEMAPDGLTIEIEN
jgi:hypothetical protein